MLLATSDGASNAIVATGLPPSVTFAVPICWPAFSGAFRRKRGDEKNAIKVDYNLPPSIAAPLKAGQQIGTANVTEGGKPVATIALLAPSDVARSASLTKRLLSIF